MEEVAECQKNFAFLMQLDADDYLPPSGSRWGRRKMPLGTWKSLCATLKGINEASQKLSTRPSTLKKAFDLMDKVERLTDEEARPQGARALCNLIIFLILINRALEDTRRGLETASLGGFVLFPCIPRGNFLKMDELSSFD